LIRDAAFAVVERKMGGESMQRWVSLAIGIAVIAGAEPVAAQDAVKGEAVFKRCRACHAVGQNAPNKTGPHLNGVVGRKAASVAGFDYSDAMKGRGATGLVWTDANLAAYLQAPDVFLPKGVMASSGIKDPAQLNDLIAYLKTQK
jgi:cytochrome c